MLKAKGNIQPHIFTDSTSLDAALVAFVSEKLTEAIDDRGQAILAVSGGRTPINLFKTLAKTPIRWEKITITLVDERWVDEESEASNTRLVKQYLLQDQASKADFIPVKTQVANAIDGQPSWAAQLEKTGPADVLILGMGTDGHTASLFPCSEELTSAMDLENSQPCQAVTPTTAPHQRMTMTLQWLLKSQHLVLHIVGSDKCEVLENALAEPQKPPIGQLIQLAPHPVRVFYCP